MTETKFYFFIGTIAEFIKVMPVMHELSRRKIPFKIISTGQNRLIGNDLLAMSGIGQVDIVLNDRPIKKAAIGLLFWFVETLVRGLFLLRKEFRRLNRNGVLVIHGDTVSTLMGALIGKFYGLKVAHVEAGLRSFNFLQPFPEEIDRYLASYLADIHFCPYELAVKNLRSRKGLKVDTRFNTNIDSLMFALAQKKEPAFLEDIRPDKYFIFIMHRQENLLSKTLASEIIQAVVNESTKIKCIFVMHELTRSVLTRSRLLGAIENNDNIQIVGRLPYLEFIGLLSGSEFIATDGGGNQQEAYYLGKPCLILRNVTEGSEGFDHNMVLSKNEISVIRNFFSDYQQYDKPLIRPEIRPSEIIVDVLVGT